MRLAAYGNFRNGQPLAYYLKKLRLEGKFEVITLEGVKMYAAGQAPAVIITGEKYDKAVVELIEVDMNGSVAAKFLELLDKIEGVDEGLYKRSLVDTPNGKAIIYEFNRPTIGLPVIEDWMEWIKLTPEAKWEEFQKVRGKNKGKNKKPSLIAVR